MQMARLSRRMAPARASPHLHLSPPSASHCSRECALGPTLPRLRYAADRCCRAPATAAAWHCKWHCDHASHHGCPLGTRLIQAGLVAASFAVALGRTAYATQSGQSHVQVFLMAAYRFPALPCLQQALHFCGHRWGANVQPDHDAQRYKAAHLLPCWCAEQRGKAGRWVGHNSVRPVPVIGWAGMEHQPGPQLCSPSYIATPPP